jgi:hypothetical protein
MWQRDLYILFKMTSYPSELLMEAEIYFKIDLYVILSFYAKVPL